MRKLFFLVFFALIMTLSSCVTETHQHNYENGYESDEINHWKECECGEIINKKEHKFGDWEIVTEPTENIDGLKKQVCLTCEYEYLVEIPKLNHEHNYTNEVIEPTCTEKGYTIYICSCGDTYTDTYVDVIDHVAVVDNAVAPTCTSTGLTRGSHCSLCNEVLVPQKEVAILEHNYNTVVTEPTCEEMGYTTYICKRCEYSYESDEVEALNHNTVLCDEVKPTSNQRGHTEYYDCTRCDYKINYYETIYFGSYPQTIESDKMVVNSLNLYAEITENGYYELNDVFYAKVTVTSTYSDIEFSDGCDVKYGETKWFVVEPILWRILYESDSEECFLVSDYILDCSQFYSNSSNRTIDDNIVYANNYKYSDVRKLLLNDFYNNAFTWDEKNKIVVKEVDNSSQTTINDINEFSCENTIDPIFLLSFKDITNSLYGFDKDRSVWDIARRAVVSDYSRAKGVYCYYDGFGLWWTRSPSFEESYTVNSIDYLGICWYNGKHVSLRSQGVRPAVILKNIQFN